MIKINNLFKQYRKKVAVNDLTLNIPKRCVYGLIGLNGAGKSTTLNCIATLTIPTKGDIIVDKYSVTKDANEVKKIIGLLPQDSGFYEGRTMLSHMEYYCNLKGEDPKVALKIINMMDLDKVKDTKVSNLSHGMKKSLGLAQALIGSPKLLLLDEPFSGLDPLIRVKIRKIITEYAKRSTILICSHDLVEIERLCDRIGIIDEGMLVFETKLKDMKKKSLEELFLKLVKRD